MLDLIIRKRKRPGRKPAKSHAPSGEVEIKVGHAPGNLKADIRLIPDNPKSAPAYFSNRKNKESLRASSVFFYGKVWFYNTILEAVLGNDWQKSKEIQIIHSPKQLTKNAQKDKRKPLIILPSVHDQTALNILVSRSLETNSPVWFIGYPSTLAKHLLASFQSFILCDASNHEIEILSDVTELSSMDVDFLKEKQKRAVVISKGNAQTTHLEF